MNVVGSLKEHINAWRRINANEEVINWIDNGVTFPFSSQPTPYQFQNHKFSQKQVDFVDSEIGTLLLSGAIF